MLCLSPGLALHAWERDDPRPPICTRPRSFFFFISFYGGVREGGEPHTHTHTYYWVLFFTPTRKRWGWYPVHDVSQPLMWDLDYEMWCVRFWVFFLHMLILEQRAWQKPMWLFTSKSLLYITTCLHIERYQKGMYWVSKETDLKSPFSYMLVGNKTMGIWNMYGT